MVQFVQFIDSTGNTGPGKVHFSNKVKEEKKCAKEVTEIVFFFKESYPEIFYPLSEFF